VKSPRAPRSALRATLRAHQNCWAGGAPGNGFRLLVAPLGDFVGVGEDLLVVANLVALAFSEMAARSRASSPSLAQKSQSSKGGAVER
jgi:hypothetical protein